jgi:alanine-synthesizing transaminase
MRVPIVEEGAENLKYEIRKIVALAKKIEQTGVKIVWENIGDPVAKGFEVPAWIKEKIATAVTDNTSYAYSPTAGLESARTYIAGERNAEGGIHITKDDIFFFNGLGDAISTIYSLLQKKARVIGPNPAYPTHSSAESAHADSAHITYTLNPNDGWKPDLLELEEKIKANNSIAGILIINPDNPTGFVYPQETLQAIVALAKKYSLFLISDEIYSNLAFPDSGMKKLASVVGDVPAIAMRGISKEFPWPGARCGWLEFYNRDKDKEFDEYCKSIMNSKMLEVCATTLPQAVLPQVMDDARYYPYLEQRVQKYQKRACLAKEKLSVIPELIVNEPRGAFYMTVVFRDGALNDAQSLPVSIEVEAMLAQSAAEEALSLDRRFTNYLLGSEGICVVALSSGFNSDQYGFRFTLLEEDDEKFDRIIESMIGSIQKYLQSSNETHP